MNIEKMLAGHIALATLYRMLNDLVNEAERTYCASGKADDKRRLDKLMQSRAALIESMSHFAEAGGAEIVQSAKVHTGETLNANGRAL